MNLSLRSTVPAPGARTPFRTTAVIAATFTLTLVASACSSGADHGTDHAGVAATTSTAPSDSRPPSAAAAAHNDADIAFADGMIVHHRGAVDMSALAADRADSDAVRGLAARIRAAQQPEIDQMTSWLQTWSAPGADTTSASATAHDMSGHDMSGPTMSADSGADHAAMGMMSAADMATLTAATGADFDRQFLDMMIVHHQGAVDMSRTELTSGRNPSALALAQAIVDSQTAEIAEMQGLLAAG